VTDAFMTGEQLAALLRPLNPNRVARRSSSGSSLSYLEAWDVKATLIRVFGFGGFSAEVLESKILREEEVAQVKNTGKTNWKVTAQATVRLHIHQTGAVYTETAVGGSSQPDYTESADMALKTAESDALKRAAIYLGTQFGLSLYNDASTSDVVRVVLAPGQKEIIDEMRQEQAETQATAAQQQVARALSMKAAQEEEAT
jgi:recombination DNA repair RAD52 pathway protein